MTFLEPVKNPGKDDGCCALCKISGLDEKEHRCHGCGYLVCGDCDINMPFGSHLVVAHNAEDDEW